MARSARILFLPLLIAAVCAVSTGCPRTPPPPSSSPYRFIETSPAEVFDLSRIASSTHKAAWKFEAVPGSETWSAGGGSAHAAADGTLIVKATSERAVTVDLNFDGPADSVDLFEIVVQGLRQGKWVRLYWAGDSQQFHISRSLTTIYRDGIGQDTKLFSLTVADVASWVGAISRLRIEIATEAGQEISIVAFRSKTRDVISEQLQRALAQPWYVEAGNEHRCALLAIPGQENRRTLRLPRDANLRFAYSAPPTQREPVTFRVVVQDVAGNTVFVDESYILPANSDGVWRAGSISLGELGDSVATIVLGVESSDAFDPLNGLPAWANPEICWSSGATDRPNVVMISLDTLRADHTSLYGYERSTTPNISAWAEKSGTVFSTVVAPAPWTLPSHASIFSGLDSLVHGAIHSEPVSESITTLAELLRSAGYATAAITGGSYLNPQYGLSQGFDVHRSIGGDPAEELEKEMKFAVNWLDSRPEDQPFFMFFHTYEIHDPYTPRKPFLEKFSQRSFDPEMKDIVTRPTGADRAFGYRPRRNLKIRYDDPNRAPTVIPWEEVQTAIDVYDSGIAYADQHIGQLLAMLEAPKLVDRTIVVLLSDHGESFGEHGFASHGSLYDHDLLVPLVIAPVRGSRRVREVGAQVRLIDVMPTVLDFTGIKIPAEVSGRTLVPLMAGKNDSSPREALSYAAVTNFGIGLRSSGRKYIYRNAPWSASTGWEELYELGDDPHETTNLVGSSMLEPYRETVLAHLDEFLGGLWITIDNPGDAPMNGYLESPVIGRDTRTTSILPNCRLEKGNRLAYSIPPEESLEIVVERIEEPLIEISGTGGRGASDPPPPFSLQIGTSGGPHTTSMVLKDQRWVEGPATDIGQSITFDWRPPPGGQPTRFEIEGDLEEQLRALGYIQ